MNQSKLVRVLALILFIVAFLLACRTAQLLSGNSRGRDVSNNTVREPTETVTRARPSATPFGAEQPPPPVNNQPPPIEVPPQGPPTSEPPPQVMPTDLPQPPPVQQPTEPNQPPIDPLDDSGSGVSATGPSIVPTPQANAPAPTTGPTAVADAGPTRCPQTYCVVFRGCEPDSGNTIVEGYVYNNGVPENGVPVRAALEEGGYPLVEFVSGTDPINPGQPDPKNPGKYILQIVAGQAREGNWWIFAVDVPNGTKRISESKLVHTNDDPFNPENCQHAYVDFVR